MRIKDLFFPFVIIPLGIAFAVLCFLLYINGGKNRQLIAAKIRTGAIILSFSYFVSCGSPVVHCYDPAPPSNSVMIYKSMDLHPGDTIKGNVFDPSFTNYSYRIMDAKGEVKYQESFLSAREGGFAKNQGSFFLVLDNKLSEGNYVLNIYSENSTSISCTNLLESSPIRILPIQPK